MIAESLYCVKDFIYLSLRTEYEQSSCLDDNLFSFLFGCFTPLAINDCRVWVLMELVKIGAAMLSAVELTETKRRR